MDPAKVQLLEDSLMRAAEVVGDLHEPTFARYYSRFPQAREEFLRHAMGDDHRLEAMMIENCLYCIMTWLERPLEVEILLLGSVVHHIETLKVEADRYAGLLDAMIDVLVESVPPEAADELALWSEIRAGLRRLITRGAEAELHRTR